MNTGLLRLLSGTLLLSFAVVAFSQAEQVIAITAVTNSADFQRGLPQKGSLASIFTTGLKGEPGILTAAQYPLSNTLGGISVWVNFLPASAFSIAFDKSYQQINVMPSPSIVPATPSSHRRTPPAQASI